MRRARADHRTRGPGPRPPGSVGAPADPPPGAPTHPARNTTRDRLVTFHFFEPLERFKVMVRSPRVRPVVFVPFRLPNVATPDVVRRVGFPFCPPRPHPRPPPRLARRRFRPPPRPAPPGGPG